MSFRPSLGTHSRTKLPNISIHPRRPRLTEVGVKVPKDLDGAFRAEKRLDESWIDLKGAPRMFGRKDDPSALGLLVRSLEGEAAQ